MTSSVPPAGPAGSRSLWLAPLLVFVLALLFTTALLVSLTRSIEAKDEASFQGEVLRTTEAVRERVDTTITLLRGTAGLFAASREVSRQEFADYVRLLRLRQRYPGILGIGFTERIPAARLPARMAGLRAAGMPGFRVWPEQTRDEYHSIVFIEPFDERNRAAIGYDMTTEPTRRAAMMQARDEAVVAASGKVFLVQETEQDKQPGVLIYLPIYRSGKVPGTVEGRREALLGFVYAALRVTELLQGVRGSGVQELDYELYDGQRVPAALLRSTRDAGSGEPEHRMRQEVEVGGRVWLLDFSSRPAFEALSQRRLVPWLGAMSLAGSLLLGWITLVQARARRAAETAAVQQRLAQQALRESEEQVRDRAERLEQLYAELREGERRKDEFLAVLAHELRNPLAPIRTSLEIMKRAPDSPAAERAREIAARQLRHMVRLIDDLLDVSRISRGKIVLQRERVPLADVVEAAVETSRPLVEARGHQLHVAPVDPSLALDIDPARVAQIFSNLLNNAATYTPPGGEIHVTVQADGPWVRVAVRDNGIGIEAEQLSHVFELFRQLDRSADSSGLGIGLSLSARLAELHGGRIEASSEGRGRGSEFVVVLPRDAAPPSPPKA